MTKLLSLDKKKSFSLVARNIKHEIINSYWWWKEESNKYKKDIFVNIYSWLENKKILPEKVPVNAPFVEKITEHYLYNIISFSRPFKTLQADIAYIGFLVRSAVNKKVTILTSMTRMMLLMKRKQITKQIKSKKRKESITI